MIISHTILILQLRYSREATANRAPGQTLVFTAPGRFESAPVVENVEVAAATGGCRDNDDDDDDDDNDDDDEKPSGGGIITNSHADRKRKFRGKSLKLGPIKLVRGGGWCDNCDARATGPPLVFSAKGRFESAPVGPVVENVEVAAAAGGDGGDSDGEAGWARLILFVDDESSRFSG